MAKIDELTVEVQTKAKSVDDSIDKVSAQLEGLAKAVGKVPTSTMSSIAAGLRNISREAAGFKGNKSGEIRSLSSALQTLDKVNNTSIHNVAHAMRTFAGGMKELSGVSFNPQGVLNAANSLSKLGGVKAVEGTKNLKKVKNDLIDFSNGLNGIGAVNFDATGLANVISSIARLGGKSASEATKNLPGIKKDLIGFVKGLNGIGSLNFDTTGIANLTSSISKLGGKASTNAIKTIPQLSTALKNMMSTLSTAPRVSQNVIQMTNALARLASQGGRVGSASNILTKGLNNISSGSKRANKNILGLAFSFGKFYAAFALVKQGISALSGAVEYASDLAEVQNVIDVTFGNSKNVIEDFSKNAIKQFGISELAAKDTAGRFQAMGTAVGFSQSKMAEMSVELTKLSADMASFYNVSQKEVATSLQSIFTGETEPMRRYGTDLTQATLQEWALKQGIDADMQSMSQAEKVMLRYQYVIANTGAATGDFARTSASWANSVRILSEQFKVLGSVIGKGVIAAFKPFIQMLNNVMGKVISFSETVLNALGTIFGWKFEISAGGLTDDLGESAGYTDDLASGAGDASDGYKQAAKNAEKLKNVVLGIDELNINAPDNDTGSAGGSSGIPSGGGLGDLGTGAGGGLNTNMFATDTILKAYESSIDSLYKLGEYIRDTLIKTMDGIEWEKVYEQARGFGKGLADFLNGLFAYNGDGKTLFGQVGRTLSNTLNTVVYSALSFGQRFDFRQFGINVADGINNVFSNFDFTSLAQTLNVWVDGLWDFIGGFLGKIKPGDVFKGIKNFIGTLDLDTLTIIIGAIAWKLGAGVIIKNTLLALISKGVSGLVLNLTGVELGKVTFVGVAKAIGVALKNALAGISGTIISTISSAIGVSGGAAVAIFAGVIAGIVAVGIAIKDLWDTSESFRQSVSEMWKKIAGAFSEAKTAIWDNTLVPLWGNIKSLIEAMKGAWSIVYQAYDSSGLKYVFEQMLTFWGDTLSTKIANAIKIIGVVFETVGGVVGGIIEILAGAINFVTGHFSGDWKKAWQGAKDIVKGVSDSIASVLSGLWETIKIIFAPTIKYFSENFTGAYNAVKSAFSFIDTWFDEKWKAIKAVFSLTVQFFSETFTNGYNAVKAAFSFINTYFETIPSK